MYMYMYICIYIYIYICIYVPLYICIYVYEYICTNVYVYIYIYSNPVKNNPKKFQNSSKIHQVGGQNPLIWGPKSTKIGPQSLFGGVLGPSWPQEAPRHQKMVRKGRALPPPPRELWPPSWSPKSIKIGPKSDPKGDHFFD